MTDPHQLDVATTDGGVAIGTEPTGPSAYFFPVFGAVVGIDLTDPDGRLYTLVSDHARAAWWLSHVYDDAVSRAVGAAVAAGESGEAEVATTLALPENRGWLWNALYRYGAGRWLQQFWPSHDAWDVAPGSPAPRIDEPLIDLEVGVCAWSCQFVLGGLSPARQYLQGREQQLLELARGGAGDPGLIGPALRATIESVPLPDPVVAELRAQESIEATVAREHPSDDDIAEASSAMLLVQARGASTDTTRLRFDVDPRQLPGRALSAAPGAVGLDLVPEPGGIRTVVSVAAGDRPTDQVIWAMVYHGGGTPIATFALDLDPERGQYAASAVVEAAGGPLRRDRLYVRLGTADRLTSPDPELVAELRGATMPIFRMFLDRSRVVPDVDVPVHELAPVDGWRALAPAGTR